MPSCGRVAVPHLGDARQSFLDRIQPANAAAGFSRLGWWCRRLSFGGPNWSLPPIGTGRYILNPGRLCRSSLQSRIDPAHLVPTQRPAAPLHDAASRQRRGDLNPCGASGPYRPKKIEVSAQKAVQRHRPEPGYSFLSYFGESLFDPIRNHVEPAPYGERWLGLSEQLSGLR